MIREFNNLIKLNNKKYKELHFMIIDYDALEEIADYFDIDKPPTSLFIVDKQVQNSITHKEIYLIDEYLDELITKKLKIK
jgi:hypothetical protein